MESNKTRKLWATLNEEIWVKTKKDNKIMEILNDDGDHIYETYEIDH